jgi:hypothetical protein
LVVFFEGCCARQLVKMALLSHGSAIRKTSAWTIALPQVDAHGNWENRSLYLMGLQSVECPLGQLPYRKVGRCARQLVKMALLSHGSAIRKTSAWTIAPPQVADSNFIDSTLEAYETVIRSSIVYTIALPQVDAHGNWENRSLYLMGLQSVECPLGQLPYRKVNVLLDNCPTAR